MRYFPVFPTPMFGFFYRTQVSLGSDLWVWAYVRTTLFADLTDVTLADEDTNSILADNDNRASSDKKVISGKKVIQ